MDEDIVVLKRDELYKLVWSEPIQRLSKKYGLSDVGLAKICRKMEIPIPGRGYWMKKKSGRTMLITPLPIARENTIQQTRIQKREKEVKQESQIEEPEIIKSERLPENRIIVAQRLYRPDPLIETTERALKKAKPDDWGRLRIFGAGCLDLRVGRDNVHRALLIFDSLIKALKERGHIVSVKQRKTQVSVLDENMDIRLVENTKRSERTLTKEEMIRKEIGPHFYYSNRYLYTLTSKLSLVADLYGPHNLCSDGKKRPLEDSLNECMMGLIKIALGKKQKRAEREREQKEWEERRLRREEEEKLLREEETRFRALLKDAADWNSSHLIRQYLEAVKKIITDNSAEIRQGAELAKWLDWATQKANLLDPIGSGRMWQQVNAINKLELVL
jgi:hypothetical protein